MKTMMTMRRMTRLVNQVSSVGAYLEIAYFRTLDLDSKSLSHYILQTVCGMIKEIPNLDKMMMSFIMITRTSLISCPPLEVVHPLISKTFPDNKKKTVYLEAVLE